MTQVAVAVTETVIVNPDPHRTVITFQNLDAANYVDVYDGSESNGIRLWPHDSVTFSLKDGDKGVPNAWYGIASVALTVAIYESLDPKLFTYKSVPRQPGRGATIITSDTGTPGSPPPGAPGIPGHYPK